VKAILVTQTGIKANQNGCVQERDANMPETQWVKGVTGFSVLLPMQKTMGMLASWLAFA